MPTDDDSNENKPSTPSIMPASTGAPPPKDKYQLLKEEYNRLRDENKQSRAVIENYDCELRKRGGELLKAKDTISDLHNELINLHQQLEDARTLAEVRGKELVGLQVAKDTISDLHNEFNLHQQLEDARTLAEVRGKELVGLQVFLTKADTLSISDVGDRVNALNEEIFQAAATLGDALIHKRHEVSLHEMEAAVAVSMEVVGEKMTMTLIAQAQKPELEVNPLLVQVVLQIFMVEFCVSKVESWYPGDSAIAEFLSVLYSEIRSTEEQAVSGRWRALTRSHTRPSAEKWKDELFKKLQSILVVASWTIRSTEDEKPYRNRLPTIFRAINELRTGMGENFTSADLEIFVFECHEIYDPRTMEDAYGDGGQSSRKRAPEAIVGTTGIGLGKIMAKDTLHWQIQVLTPAKIVLTSTMDEALQPIQRKKMKKNKKTIDFTDGVNQDGRD